jgi:ATP-dependent exoDNAse (exonuclease V) alpha subunit
MNLTQGQELALRAIQEVGQSHPDGGGIVVISGYAGTGKTTLLRTLAEDEDLTVLAPTGKAAVRASEVAPSVDAQTIHRWLYDVEEDPQTGKLRSRVRADVMTPRNKTVFIDEASMVTFTVFRDLYKTAVNAGLNLVFLGDGFQLPPVEFQEKYRDFSVLASDSPAHYRVEMTEVVRQALDSPIIRASMELRDLRSNLEALSALGTVKPSQVAEVGARTFENDGATICHRNATRHKLNNEIRQALGITHEKVQPGEPLMVIANSYDLDVFNGEIVTVRSTPQLVGDKSVIVRDRFANESLNMWFYETLVDTPHGPRKVLFADREVFGTSGKIGQKFIRRAGMDLSRTMTLNEMRATGEAISYEILQGVKGTEHLNANLGYALTAHKAQGSEFPAVVVCIEDSVRLHDREGRRWAYTALTRAKKDVKVCWM